MSLQISQQNERHHHAVEVFAGRLKDRQIHYGLIFALPAGLEKDSIRQCSDLETRSRHGQVADWWLGRLCAAHPAEYKVLLIPRTWLIRQRFLPWWVLFFPYQKFAVRRAADLQAHVWLEWSDRPAADEDLPLALAA